MKRALWEAAGIAGMALLLAIAAAFVRPGMLAFLFEPPPQQAAGENIEAPAALTLADAHQALNRKNAIFADARSPEDFRQAHISGAINLPAMDQEAWLDRVMTDLDPALTIIAYCSNANCHLARELADTLIAAGFQHVFYLKAGLDVWREQGLPTESD